MKVDGRPSHGPRPSVHPRSSSLGARCLAQGWCDSYPGLKALHGTVLAHQGVAAYLASDRRYPFPAGDVGAKYVANVNTVLGR